jgi:hypothetical protein
MKKKTKMNFSRQITHLRLLNFTLLFGLVGVLFLFFAAAAPIPGYYGSVEQDQVNRINGQRAAIGRGSLKHIECLNTVAELWTKKMVDRGGISHNPSLANEVQYVCGGAWSILGENVGVGYSSDGIFTAFMNSPGHKANIIDGRFTKVGTGAYWSPDGRLFVTQVFANCSSCTAPWNTNASLPADPVAPRPIFVPGAIATALSSDGRLHSFVRGGDGAVYVAYQLKPNDAYSWSGFGSLGGYINSNIAAINNKDGRMQIFVRGGDNSLYTNAQTCPGTCGFGGWVKIGGLLTSDPSVSMSGDGRIYVFVRGGDNQGYYTSQTAPNSGNWHGFTAMGGLLSSNIAASTNKDGRVQAFVRGGDNSLYTNAQTSCVACGFGGWAKIGGLLASDTHIAVSGDRLHAFVRGGDNSAYFAYQKEVSVSGGWSGFGGLGGLMMSNVTAITNADGRMQAFVVSTDGQVYTTVQTSVGGGWSGFFNLGGLVMSDVNVAKNQDGRLQIFVLGTDKSVYTMVQGSPSGNFAGNGAYHKIGGIIESTPALNVPGGQR